MRLLNNPVGRTAACVVLIAVVLREAGHTDYSAFGSSDLTQNVELVFNQAVQAIERVGTQGPSALLDLVHQWGLTLANAFTKPHSY